MATPHQLAHYQALAEAAMSTRACENWTTERFSRRLGERVPDARYACAVEKPRTHWTLLGDIASCALLGVMLAAGLVYWWSAQ